MGVRVGADVGGTFTKAVAIDSVTGALAGRADLGQTVDRSTVWVKGPPCGAPRDDAGIAQG